MSSRVEPIVHLCFKCGGDAPWGFGVNVPKGNEGQWACAAHKDELEAAAQARREAVRVAMTPAQGNLL